MVRYLILVCIICVTGCNNAPDKAIADRAAELSKTYVKHAEEVVAKQDQSIEILKANTDVLVAIKAAVEGLSSQPAAQPDQQILDTLEAIKTKLDEPKPLKPVAQTEPLPAPVVVPLIEPQVGKIVSAPPVRTTSSKAKLRWNVNGNWSPTITETATHLRAEHGVNIDGLTEQQLHDLHADLHEGKSGGQPVGAIFPNPPASAVTSQRIDFRPVAWGANFVGRARYSTRQSCPGGRCPRR